MTLRVWPNKRLKKAPLPGSWRWLGEPEKRIEMMLWIRFKEMFGSERSISNPQRVEWGRFLAERGVSWDIHVRHRPDWEGWEAVNTEGGLVARPKGIEDHIRVNHYYVPRELAMRMLVLGVLM